MAYNERFMRIQQGEFVTAQYFAPNNGDAAAAIKAADFVTNGSEIGLVVGVPVWIKGTDAGEWVQVTAVNATTGAVTLG